MAYYNKRNTDKRLCLMAELVINNHPVYKNSPFREAVIDRPADFNMEHLVEQMMALNSNGQYEFNDGIHEDFSDESEGKTGTLHVSATATAAEITNVRSPNGVLKRGAIRAVILNPVLNKLHFIFIPKEAVQKYMTTKGKPTKSTSIWLRYNTKKNEFTTLTKYGAIEFETFKQLSMEPNR